MTTYQRQSHRQKKYAEDIASIYFSEEEKSKVKKDLLRKKKRLAKMNKSKK